MHNMIRKITGLALLGVACLVNATSIAPRDIEELVPMADHVLIVTIVEVDMIDRDGNLISDPKARTGPGLDTTIRMHARVHADGILKTNQTVVPEVILIPLWGKWHHTLEQIREEIGAQMVVLLKGPDFLPVYPALFRQAIESVDEIVRLIEPSCDPQLDGECL